MKLLMMRIPNPPIMRPRLNPSKLATIVLDIVGVIKRNIVREEKDPPVNNQHPRYLMIVEDSLVVMI
jgi:hypothetical protein